MSAASVLIAALCFLSPLASAASAEVRDSVVKVEVTSRLPDLARPWSKRSPTKSSGTGVMIEGGKILTNAHVIRFASQIEIQPSGSSTKYAANIIAEAPEIDLALLELEDPTATELIPPLAINPDLPALRQDVTVLGYPVGGNELSITEGIVSRIEFSSYYYETKGLRIQIDAALNPGNSGGPAVSGDQLIGLVFSKIREADNIGYLIPVEEIQKFMADVEDGAYQGKASLAGDGGVQQLENPALRRRLGLSAATTGVMFRTISDDNEHPLKTWDVITHIGEHNIDNQGFIRLSDEVRLTFDYYIDKLAENGHIPMTVVRDGETLQLQIPVEYGNQKVLTRLAHSYPEYFIWGPMVFTSASQELATAGGQRMWGLFYATGSPLLSRLSDRRSFPGEEIVVIPNRLFPHRITRGYGTIAMSVVEGVNGEKVKSLDHLVTLLRDAQGEYVTFDLAGSYPKLVFNRAEAEEATEEILTDEGIRRRASPRLRKVWEAEAPAEAG